MTRKSLQDVAFELLTKKKKPVEFAKLWSDVNAVLGLTAEEAAAKVATFYTRLTLDGRFVNLGDNVWDLRSRQTFDKVHIDMNDAYSDEVEDDRELDEEIISDGIVAVVEDEEDEEEDDDDEDDYGDGD